MKNVIKTEDVLFDLNFLIKEIYDAKVVCDEKSLLIEFYNGQKFSILVKICIRILHALQISLPVGTN